MQKDDSKLICTPRVQGTVQLRDAEKTRYRSRSRAFSTVEHSRKRKERTSITVHAILDALQRKGEVPAAQADVLTRPAKEELSTDDIKNVFSYRNELRKW